MKEYFYTPIIFVKMAKAKNNPASGLVGAAPTTRAPRKTEPSEASTNGATRLSAADREREIVQGAISYFSEVGFSGDTTALAKRLGIKQPLLYRYFASKDALISRVFEETFLAHWNPLWEEMLLEKNEDVATRLLAFHRDFARVHLRRERVRLSLFFGLHGWDMSPYFRLMRQKVYLPIAASLREYAGAAAPTGDLVSDVEVELAKTVVEKIQYYGIRKWVYQLAVPEIDPLVGASVRSLLDGAKAALLEQTGGFKTPRKERQSARKS